MLDDEATLPQDVSAFNERFVAAAQEALGDDLTAIILFGSAAEGRLRVTSDVNVLVVVERWQREQVDRMRDPIRTAVAGIRLAPMFVRSDELADCAVAPGNAANLT